MYDNTTERSWRQLRQRLFLLYLVAGIALLVTSGIGHAHILISAAHVTGPSAWEAWFSTDGYGLSLIAGIIWLLVGAILLANAPDWTGAVEGITLLPPALFFLLSPYWLNVYQANLASQLVWLLAFALPGASLLHLSLVYRPAASKTPRSPALWIDGAPYLPLLALLAFDIGTLLIKGSAQANVQLTLARGYGILGGILSLLIDLISLLRILHVLPGAELAAAVRRRLGNLLSLWITGICLSFGLGVLPFLLANGPLVPLQALFLLAAAYPLVLLYIIRTSRLLAHLEATLHQREATLKQREEVIQEQQKLAVQLHQSNNELQRATSLLLHADAHLRSILSQRLHDQPKQHALRIRSLLAHWQHKLRLETENDPRLRTFAQPVIEALGKVRKISEELEGDLRGLQLLIEDSSRRRSQGLKLHLEALIREDLPTLHPESPLRIQPDLWALDALSPDLEQTPEGQKFAEAISYTVTQALLNIYNHAGATFAYVRAVRTNGFMEIMITDDGHGFDPNAIPHQKTSLFKARLKAREAGGTLTIFSAPRSQPQHGTTILLRLPLPPSERTPQHTTRPLSESLVEEL
jgi:signal transduction histidine kinase